MPRPFDPIKASDLSLGQICPLCNKPLEVGQIPSLIVGAPSDEEEKAKKEAGRAYTAIGKIVHWECTPESKM